MSDLQKESVNRDLYIVLEVYFDPKCGSTWHTHNEACGSAPFSKVQGLLPHLRGKPIESHERFELCCSYNNISGFRIAELVERLHLLVRDTLSLYDKVMSPLNVGSTGISRAIRGSNVDLLPSPTCWENDSSIKGCPDRGLQRKEPMITEISMISSGADSLPPEAGVTALPSQEIHLREVQHGLSLKRDPEGKEILVSPKWNKNSIYKGNQNLAFRLSIVDDTQFSSHDSLYQRSIALSFWGEVYLHTSRRDTLGPIQVEWNLDYGPDNQPLHLGWRVSYNQGYGSPGGNWEKFSPPMDQNIRFWFNS